MHQWLLIDKHPCPWDTVASRSLVRVRHARLAHLNTLVYSGNFASERHLGCLNIVASSSSPAPPLVLIFPVPEITAHSKGSVALLTLVGIFLSQNVPLAWGSCYSSCCSTVSPGCSCLSSSRLRSAPKTTTRFVNMSALMEDAAGSLTIDLGARS